jgi:hypothetical protein
MRLRILSMIGLAQLLLCVTCQVRSATPDWSVHVILTSGKNMNAVIDHVTAEALYLHSQTETTEVRRGDVSRVYLKKNRNWVKPVLIGAGAAGIAAPLTMEHEIGYGAAVGGTVVLGAAVGAGVGRLVSGPGESLIYRKP